MDSEKVIKRDNEYVLHTYARNPIVLEKGHGLYAEGPEGQKYLDFTSGIGVNSLGYCDMTWAEAVSGQAHKLQHTSNLYYTAPCGKLAKKLCKRTGMSRVFFGNSGAEANEGAIKAARKYSFDKYGKGRHNIITLVNSFHGRTLCTLSATGQDVFHNYFFPFVDGFINVEANNIEDLKAKLDDTVCAVMFEYIQGEGGVVPLEQKFVDAIFELCAERDVLTISDEVQTGVGRTGKFLAGDNFGKKADIITLAKGIAGGIPMGACLSGDKCAGVLTPGTHGSTFGGNPIACAGAIEVLKKAADPIFLSQVADKGRYIAEKLKEIPEVESVTGMGLMIGIKLKTKNAKDILNAALEHGLLILTAKEKLRLLPPLTISYEDIDRGLEILAELLK